MINEKPGAGEGEIPESKLPSNNGENSEREQKFILTALVPQNGWMRPDGLSFACSQETHDACARNVLKQEFPEVFEELYSVTSESAYSSIRREIGRRGFVQLSNGQVMHPEHPLTEAQLKKLDQAGLKFEVTITEVEQRQYFTGMLESIRKGEYSNHTLMLIQQFFDNELRFLVNDEPEDAYEVFNAVTKGFLNGGEIRDAYQHTETRREYSIEPEGRFCVVVHYYKHAGDSGVMNTTTVYVLPAEKAPDYEEYFGNKRKEEETEDLEPIEKSNSTDFTEANDEIPERKKPKIKTPRIKGMSSRDKRNRLEKILDE